MADAILPSIRKYPRIAIDTETTGLSHIDVPVGFSWATPDGQSGYLRWGHQEGGNNVSLERVRDWALQEFTNYKGIITMQEANYDIRMLDNVGIPLIDLNTRIEDTKFMAALINELSRSFSLGSLLKQYNLPMEKEDGPLNEIVESRWKKPPDSGPRWQAGFYWRLPGDVVESYAISDAVGTLALAELFIPLLEKRDLMQIFEVETALIPILARMYRHGVRVDVDRAQHHLDRISREIEELMPEWDKYGIPLSGKGSKKLLYEKWEELGLPFETTKKGNRSVNAIAIAKAKELHPFPSLLEKIRKREKMKTTFMEGYIFGHVYDGRIHSTFHPLKTDDYGTISGRFSSSNPNLQNPYSPGNDDPDETEDNRYGHLFRSFFIPEEGRRWGSIDYSQIEYRFFAHYAGGRVLKAYQDDPTVDFHQMTADLAGIDRKPAKNLNFAKLFGAGLGKQANMLTATFGRRVSKEEAAKFSREYDEAVPEAANLLTLVKMRAEQRGYIKTWGGRKRRFYRRQGRYVGTHAALNGLVQGSAADLMKRAMIALDEIIDWDNVILHLTVHDEVDASVPYGEEGDRWFRQAREVMTDFDLSLPILVDIEHGENWGYLEPWEG